MCWITYIEWLMYVCEPCCWFLHVICLHIVCSCIHCQMGVITWWWYWLINQAPDRVGGSEQAPDRVGGSELWTKLFTWVGTACIESVEVSLHGLHHYACFAWVAVEVYLPMWLINCYVFISDVQLWYLICGMCWYVWGLICLTWLICWHV